MEFLVAIVRFFFCGLNMVSSISIYRTSAFCLLLVIIVNVNIMSTVLQVLFDYFISHLTCPPTCHQARNNFKTFKTFHTHPCAAAGQPGVRQVVVPSEQNPQQDQILLHLLLHSLINIALCEHFGHKLFVSLICCQFPCHEQNPQQALILLNGSSFTV